MAQRFVRPASHQAHSPQETPGAGDDAVADREALHPVAERLDPADELVADDQGADVAAARMGLVQRDHVRAVGVLGGVGAADRRHRRGDQHLPEAGIAGGVRRLDPDVTRSVEDGGAHRSR